MPNTLYKKEKSAVLRKIAKHGEEHNNIEKYQNTTA